jgi:hypothetical protein
VDALSGRDTAEFFQQLLEIFPQSEMTKTKAQNERSILSLMQIVLFCQDSLLAEG